ncbi:MAG TPA: hypothetical protein VE010_03935, partial [Thermoanaerobaculia bacterium]|nr:hypothetical protein [Thermoanaerobaculia bacterium]
MTTKAEWQAINRELTAEQRRTLEPPTAEELHAYFHGELEESEMERVRDLLVAYPDLARMYTEPFPTDEPAP